MTQQKEFKFADNVQMCAERFSQYIEQRFIAELKHAEAFVGPIESADIDGARTFMLNVFMEYLIGTSVAIFGHYASIEPQAEENVVALVRDKFARLREFKNINNQTPQVTQ